MSCACISAPCDICDAPTGDAFRVSTADVVIQDGVPIFVTGDRRIENHTAPGAPPPPDVNARTIGLVFLLAFGYWIVTSAR